VNDISTKLIIEKLIAEGFLNEERFAETYTHSKLRSNYWGKIKIIQGLKEKSIDSQIIHAAIESINKSEYQQIIKKLLNKKLQQIRDTDSYIIKNKIARYIISKGFESNLVWDEINNQFDK
jgi:regulatory protein